MSSVIATRSLSDVVDGLQATARRVTAPIVAGKNWSMRVGLVAAALSLLVQAPEVGPHGAGNWRTVATQSLHPFRQLDAAAGSHQAKLTWRLVPPLLIRFGHLTPVSYYVLQVVLGVVTFAFLASLFARVGYSRLEAFVLVLAIAFTAIGATWFTDTAPYFDAIALTALVSAMMTRHPLAVLLMTSIAVWTDERAIIASIVVAAFHVRERERSAVVGVCAALVTYVVGRAALAAHYGLVTDRTYVGPKVAIWNYLTRPLALASSIEGLWVVIAVGVLVGVMRRDRTAWIVVLMTLASAAAALMVYDTTRSAAYLLPAVVLAAAYFAAEPASVRKPLLVAVAGLCFVFPTVFNRGPEFPAIYPLPVQAVIWVHHILG